MRDNPKSPARVRTSECAGIDAGHSNQATVASYEHCALDYALSTEPTTLQRDSPLLQRLLSALHGGETVLEIGSGPGWEADWLEQEGLTVRRTDAAEAFVAFQRQRGKAAERLDVVRDPVGGSYGAIVAFYVFQHIDRLALPAVLSKVAAALHAGGALLFTILEGEGESIETGSDGRPYYIARWRQAELEQLLGTLGLRLLWSGLSEDSEGRWISLLCRRGDQNE